MVIFTLIAVVVAAADVTCEDKSCKEEGELLNLLQVMPEGEGTLSARDVARAKQLVPGPAFLAAHGESNGLLNKHLLRITKGNAKPCEHFVSEDLDQVLAAIDQKSHPHLQEIYDSNRHPSNEGWKDSRGSEAATLNEDKLSEHPELHAMVKAEKKCYDAAMRFTHSISDADKKELLASHTIPLLPERGAHETEALLQTKLGDAWAGERVFNANCAACHAGGWNAIMPQRSLRKDALESYPMIRQSDIVYQVTNGKNAMPAFGGRLSDDDIADVADYVLQQANSGW
ncbi:unnamed protein product [Effrenium voratum]|nr:unnamed protein product [Effrenium voratum]